MAKADGSVVIEILGDASDITSKLSDVAGKAVTGLKTAFAGTAAAVGASTAAVGAFAKQSLDAYADYEQLVGGVETLFKDNADIVMNYASNAYQTAGLSANQYMETVTGFSASLLQSLGGDTKQAAQVADMAITDMSDNANKMGTSMESIQYAYQGFAKQNYTMLDNLKLGYGGTKEEMQRLLQDAEKLSGQKFDLSSYADIVEAIHVVQTEMGITGTTAAEAASTIQGSVGAAGAAWQNLVTGIADENADLSGLIDNFVSSAETAAQNIIPRITQILSGMGEAIQQIAPILAEQIPAMIGQVAPGLVSAGAQLLTGLVTGIVSALPTVAAQIPAIVQSIASAFSSSAPALMAAGTQLLSMLSTGITQGIPALAAQLPGVITSVAGFISSALPEFASKGAELITALGQGIASNIPSIVSSVAGAIPEIANGIISSAATLAEAGMSIIESVGQGIISSVPIVTAKAPAIVSSILSGILSNAPRLISAGVRLISSLASGLISAIPNILGAIPAIAGAIWDGITSYDWIGLGSTIIESLGSGISSMVSAAGEAAGKILDSISNGISSLPDLLSGIGEDGISGLIEGIGSLLDSAASAAGEIGTAIVDSFGDIPGKLFSVGEDLIKGLWEGINNMAGWIGEKIAGFGEGVLNDLKNFFGIHSPSRLMRDEVGKYIGQGIAVGILDASEDVEKATNQMGDRVSNGLASIMEEEVAALEKQVEASNKFYDNLAKLEARNAPEALVEQLRDMDVDAAATLQHLVNMTDEELDNYAKLFERRQELEQSLAKDSEDEEKDKEKEKEKADQKWFEALKKRLEHETKYKDLTLQEQYKSWKAIQDQFLENSEYYAEAEEQVYNLRKQIQDEYYKKVSDTLKNIESLEENYQKEFSGRVQDIEKEYGLFTRVSEREVVSGDYLTRTLKGQIATLEEFYSNLDALAARGAPAELVEQIRDMGVDAVDELAALNSMSDKQLAEYSELFEKKHRLAVQQATKELEPLREETDAKIKEQLDSVKELYDQNVGTVGEAFTGGLAESILDGLGDVSEAAQKVVRESLAAAAREVSAFKSVSIGGLQNSISRQLKNAVEASAANLSASLTVASNAPAEASAARRQASAAQYAAAGAYMGSGNNAGDVVINVDGQKFFQATLSSLRSVVSANPAVRDDK